MKVLAETSNPCPICGTETRYTFIKSRLYVEQNLDIDYYPRKVHWLAQVDTEENPRLFYMQHCRVCHFTADHSFFTEPFKDSGVSLELFRPKFVKKRYKGEEDVNKLIELLACDEQRPGYLDALKLHLLAIFQLQRFEKEAQRESVNLGRYYLRVAWLFRDIARDEALQKTYNHKFAELFETLRPYWADVPADEPSAIRLALKHYGIAHNVSKVVQEACAEINLLTLMVRLHLTLGELEEANNVLANCQDRKLRYDMQIKDLAREVGSVSGHPREKELNQMQANARRMRKLLDDTRDLYSDMMQEYFTSQLQAAHSLYAENQSLPAAQVRQLLERHGFDETVVNRVVPVEKKRRSLLGISF